MFLASNTLLARLSVGEGYTREARHLTTRSPVSEKKEEEKRNKQTNRLRMGSMFSRNFFVDCLARLVWSIGVLTVRRFQVTARFPRKHGVCDKWVKLV